MLQKIPINRPFQMYCNFSACNRLGASSGFMAATYILANKEQCGGLGGNVGSVALIGETSEHPGSGVPARTRNQHIRQLIYIALIAGQGHIGARRPHHTARLGTIAFHSKYSLPATITARPQREDARKQAHLTTRPARDRVRPG